MKTIRSLAVLVIVPVLAVTPAAALGTSGDLAATRTFIKANYTLGVATKARVSSAEHSVGAYIAQLTHECRGAASGSPGNTQAEQLSNEVVVVLTALLYRADAPVIARLAHDVKGLHWSNPKVTRTVGRYVSRLRALSTLPVPDLCGDIKTWAAGGFKTVPATTISADKRLAAIEEAPKEVPGRLFKPYLRAGDARTLTLTARIENQLRGLESDKGASYWSTILETLALNP